MRQVPVSLVEPNCLAALHLASLDGLLTELGPYFVTRFYQYQGSTGFGFALFQDDRLAGAVVGHSEVGRAFESLRKPWHRFLAELMLSILRRPTVLLGLIRSFLESGYRPAAGEVELTYVMVEAGARGRGLGRRLVESFCEEAARRGFHSVTLAVAKENPAIRLYQRLGFEVTNELAKQFRMRKLL